jgi:hypothetical protein
MRKRLFNRPSCGNESQIYSSRSTESSSVEVTPVLIMTINPMLSENLVCLTGHDPVQLASLTHQLMRHVEVSYDSKLVMNLPR